MKLIHFYISNSNHHWQMMKPVMQQLQLKGVQVVLVSLCEFRRMETPEEELNALGIPFVKLASLKYKGASTSTGKKHIGGNTAFIRNVLRTIIWHLKVKNSVVHVNRQRPDLVVVPNDIAYPFDRICTWLSKNKIAFILQQEGIRFPLPNEEGWITYGTNGAKEILAWGEDSANYFQNLSINSKVIVAGNPRFDKVFNEGNVNSGDRDFELGKYNILYVSNPVDDQGFCTHEEKINLFKIFLEGIRPLLSEQGLKVFVRLHPRENVASFENVMKEFPSDQVIMAQKYNLFEYLRQMDLTVVLASTVGLEAMMMHVPVAVIKLPRYGYVFNYVSSNSALAIDLESENFKDVLWKGLTSEKEFLKKKCVTYVQNQLSNRGNSVEFISNHIYSIVNEGS